MMTTSFLDFNRNAEEDITNTPGHYHNFNGASLRIRCYWTKPVLRDSGLLASSFNTIRTADEILRKYTLKLDLLPPLANVTAATRTAIQEKAYARVPKAVRPLVDLRPVVVQPLHWVIDAAINSAIDENADKSVAAAGMLNFDQTIPVSEGVRPPVEAFQGLRQLIEPVTQENRLIVVFVPLSGGANGYTVLFGSWLPWVLVDPRVYDDKTVLLHEIGHACRLAHQQNDLPAMDSEAESAKYRNLMSYLHQHDRLWGWQVDTIYDSYWCTGPRPNNWWERDTRLPAGHPFMWEN
jgi:hypothetical protein